ncbi:hypothetical protein GCM10019059_06450 [Camelimonas fluminis]|uniref:Uncharacterized protein n=1 Tax=Camelimonas fluminis TaxID=1576911 RepID=A0ABV7UHQ0_9HYPH|nr:hypothetical protein [Camelimonas fluminis]GHE49914.1 hypothetical protein GCM10019059_06450 [Camelimonas fluminis]
MADVWIRLLISRGNGIEDAQETIPLSDFGGHIPSVGDRVVEMLRPRNTAYRVVERIFETNAADRKNTYIGLVVEPAVMSDLEAMPRFAPSG